MRAISFLSLILLLLAGCNPKKTIDEKKIQDPLASLYDETMKPFYHGVASGDPLHDRVIIWTRVTPDLPYTNVEVSWQLAEDSLFTKIVKSDSIFTSADKDYTVKVDVDGLQPDHYYFYNFKALGKTSMTGRTKTTPDNTVDSLSFAVVSCANWEFGYFNAFDRISEKEVDAVLHLGDYIYEYATGVYGDTTIGRKNIPAHEIVTLEDYRTRYAQYHLDAGLRKARARHPFITIWDDHEVANNVYTGGAQNHQPDKEGDFNARKAAATKAYYEWIPIREEGKLYRSFSFGNLAELVMLDERLEGRTKPVDSLTSPELFNEDRAMLGNEQLTWLEARLAEKTSAWKIIGNQVIFSMVDQSAVYPESPRNLDSWDGYPAERKRLADFILQKKINDIVFVTGDTHASWAFEVTLEPKKYDPKSSRGAFAVELGTTSVSSSNWDEYVSADTVKMQEQQLFKTNPHLRYGNARDHGYLLLSLYPDHLKSIWYYVEPLRKPSTRETIGKVVTVKKGEHKIR